MKEGNASNPPFLVDQLPVPRFRAQGQSSFPTKGIFMNDSPVYVAILIAALAVFTVLFKTADKRKERRFTPLTNFALWVVLAGMWRGEERLIGYGLMWSG